MYEAFSELIRNHPKLRLLIAQIEAEPQSPRWHFELGSAAGERIGKVVEKNKVEKRRKE